jgi:hypothetical protein
VLDRRGLGRVISERFEYSWALADDPAQHRVGELRRSSAGPLGELN